MKPPRAIVFTLFHSLSSIQAKLLYSGPEDLYAFPKHRVTFLNNLPVQNETAQHWLNEGLRGGESEFLNDRWDEPAWFSNAVYKEIGSSELEMSNDASQISQSPIPDNSGYMLNHMKMGPDNEFICLIPPARDTPMQVQENIDQDVVLRNGWSLLEPLSGKCLYHRQTWFTYSYCHNQEIRQFKELAHTQPRSAGAYEPTEDPEWEAFTLGRSPSAQDPGADVAVTDRHAQVGHLEVAHGPGSRYLVQRWGDGTFCDKTGKPREVEVQFHCSMTMADSILLVREAKTCSYVLIVQTPRLCGEPGFKSRMEVPEQTSIRCRQIINPSLDSTPKTTHLEQRMPDGHRIPQDSDLPSYLKRETRFAIPSPAAKSSMGPGAGQSEDPLDEILKRTLEALMNSPELQSLSGVNPQVAFGRGQNGEIVIEILEEIPFDDLGELDLQERNMDNYAHVAEILRKQLNEPKGEKEQEDDEILDGQGEELEKFPERKDEL
jgi:protein OS-9